VLESIYDTLRMAIRSLVRRPFYTGVVVTILTLGLAASSTVVTYINSFFRPFPGINADRLVQIYGVERDNPYTSISYPDYVDYAAGATGAFEGLAATQMSFAGGLRHGSTSDQVFGQAVSGNYFSLLGVGMALGRGFTPHDDRAEAHPVVMLSHRFWRRSFGSDTAAVGRTVYLNGKPVTVIGVAAPDFVGSVASLRPDIWLPLEQIKVSYRDVGASLENRDLSYVLMYGRLKPGFTEEQAQAELATIAAGLDEVYPRSERTRQNTIVPPAWVQPSAAARQMPAARLMLAGAIVLLLLASGNVANLMLSMATGRRRELAVKGALGASPRRLIGQYLVENTLLATAAAALALLLAIPAGVRIGSYFAQPSVWGAGVPRDIDVELRVIVVIVSIAILAGLVAGVLPALRASRQDLAEALKGDARGATPGRRWRRFGTRDLLVSLQVALSVVLLIGAGLVLRTLENVIHIDPGFDVDHLLVSIITVSAMDLDQPGRKQFYKDLTAHLEAQPWARQVSVADVAPLSGYHFAAPFMVDGQDEPTTLPYTLAAPGYFETIGLDLVRGRTMASWDTEDSFDVALVNEAFAARFFPDDDPIGHSFSWSGSGPAPAVRNFGSEERRFQIVGVVRDSRTRNVLTEPEPLVYFAYLQHDWTPHNMVLVNTAVPPSVAAPQLERELRGFHPELTLVNIEPYDRLVSGFLSNQRMNAELFTVVALIGLVLAAAGIYSVTNLAVNQRQREIGIRMAIGAYRRDIARMVITHAMGAVLLGLGLGLAVAYGVTRLVRGLLFGVGATDPVTFATGIAVLLAAALLSAFLPMRRAVRVDPIISLRNE
jgi:predicted permease